ncbi:MAG: hypothetical protein RIS25_433 [Actinomycetota bacterium]
MTAMLPVLTSKDRSLAAVLQSSFEAVKGRPNSLNLKHVKHAVIVLVDGLGETNLLARKAHARTLVKATGPSISAGFPSTTASMLTSLMTGADPGSHGLVGYSVRNPHTGLVVNQLSGLDSLDVRTWQPLPTIWEVEDQIPSAVIASPRYQHSGLTEASLRGADYVPAANYADRLDSIAHFLRSTARGVAYVYVPELDMTAHASGVESDQWIRRLEELDGFVADVARLLGPKDGMLVTADHGVIDVPDHHHIVIPSDSPLLQGVTTGGEPRCLHLYVDEPGRVDDVFELWRNAEGERATIVRRADAIDSGWFGQTTVEHAARIGDIIVLPKGIRVYFDERVATSGSRAMRGHHGGMSPAEMVVPLKRFGAFV